MSIGAAILGCAGPALSDAERGFFAETQPYGFILFARNIDTPDQIRRLTGALRDAIGRDAPILIDQEGGRVQRLRPPHWRDHLPPLDQIRMAGPEGAARSMYLRARLIAAELHALGIDVNCAPTCDVARAQTHPFLLNRCYGDDPQIVTRMARAVMDGQADGGVLSVIKHIPGHGLGLVDSHLELPRVTLPLQELRKVDFAPFQALSDAPFAMTAHIVYDALDAARPATTSPAAMAAIRDQIGFGGVLMSDDISMQALSGAIADRSRDAIAAGCDLILHCNGDMSEMRDVMAASGTLAGAALGRAQSALDCRRAPVPVDIAALEDQLDALLKGSVHG